MKRSRFARWILFLLLVGGSMICYTTGFYDTVTVRELATGYWMMGWGFTLHWLLCLGDN